MISMNFVVNREDFFYNKSVAGAVTEIIRICKDRNVLMEYLEKKSRRLKPCKQDLDIMMTLFDDEQVLEAYAEDIKNSEARENARIMLKNGRITVEEIPSFFPKLTLEDAKEIEDEVMQLA